MGLWLAWWGGRLLLLLFWLPVRRGLCPSACTSIMHVCMVMSWMVSWHVGHVGLHVFCSEPRQRQISHVCLSCVFNLKPFFRGPRRKS